MEEAEQAKVNDKQFRKRRQTFNAFFVPLCSMACTTWQGHVSFSPHSPIPPPPPPPRLITDNKEEMTDLLVGIAQLSNEDVENDNQQREEEEHHDDDGKPAVAVFTENEKTPVNASPECQLNSVKRYHA